MQAPSTPPTGSIRHTEKRKTKYWDQAPAEASLPYHRKGRCCQHMNCWDIDGSKLTQVPGNIVGDQHRISWTHTLRSFNINESFRPKNGFYYHLAMLHYPDWA